jgi:glutamate-ammonia-ligase adenylyltransferase
VTLGRGNSAIGRLARLGFSDPSRAAAALESGALGPLLDHEQVLLDLAATADPDAALVSLARLLEVGGQSDGLVEALHDDEVFRRRLLSVLGASQALAEHLVRVPGAWRGLVPEHEVRPTAAGLRRAMLLQVGADPDDELPVSREPVDRATDNLRLAYRNLLLGLAARDLAEGAEVADVAAELADLAGATLEAALALARAAGSLSSRWASAAAASSTTSAMWTSSSSPRLSTVRRSPRHSRTLLSSPRR